MKMTRVTGANGFIGSVLTRSLSSMSVATWAIGLFFYSSTQLIFLGGIVEHISMIYGKVPKRSMVLEKE